MVVAAAWAPQLCHTVPGVRIHGRHAVTALLESNLAPELRQQQVRLSVRSILTCVARRHQRGLHERCDARGSSRRRRGPCWGVCLRAGLGHEDWRGYLWRCDCRRLCGGGVDGSRAWRVVCRGGGRRGGRRHVATHHKHPAATPCGHCAVTGVLLARPLNNVVVRGGGEQLANDGVYVHILATTARAEALPELHHVVMHPVLGYKLHLETQAYIHAWRGNKQRWHGGLERAAGGAAAATAESDARNLSETRRLHCEAIQRPVNSMPLVLL